MNEGWKANKKERAKKKEQERKEGRKREKRKKEGRKEREKKQERKRERKEGKKERKKGRKKERKAGCPVPCLQGDSWVSLLPVIEKFTALAQAGALHAPSSLDHFQTAYHTARLGNHLHCCLWYLEPRATAIAERMLRCGQKRVRFGLKPQREGAFLDFPGGAVVKNPLVNAGDAGSIPDPGRSHMPRSN